MATKQTVNTPQQKLDLLLLVAYDHSAASAAAAELACSDLRETRRGGTLVLLEVLPPMHPPVRIDNDLLRAGVVEIMRTTMAEMARRLERVAEQLRRRIGAGPPLQIEALVRTGVPAERIVEVAQERGADRIYVGVRDQRLLLGSVALSVLRSSPLPVLVAHARERLLEVP